MNAALLLLSLDVILRLLFLHSISRMLIPHGHSAGNQAPPRAERGHPPPPTPALFPSPTATPATFPLHVARQTHMTHPVPMYQFIVKPGLDTRRWKAGIGMQMQVGT